MSLIKKIRKKTQNKDIKTLIENFLSLSLLQIVGYILPLITLPYIAKTIGLNNFGAIAFASAVIVFFQTLTDYGFNYTGIRDVSRLREDKRATSKVFSTIVYARFLLMVLSLMILCLCIYFIPQFNNNAKILLFTFTLIPGYVMYPEWFFQALEKMKYSAILSTVIKVLFTIFIFVFIKKEEDFIYIPLINGVGFFVVGLGAFALIYKEGYGLVKINFRDIYRTIKDSTNMFISLILPNLYSNMSTIFLENFWGKGATGVFDAGNKFLGISQQITNVLSRTFYPFLARRMDKHSFYEKMSLVISLIISISLFLGAPLIVRIFFSHEFTAAITVIRIMSLSPIFIFMMNAYGTNYLVLNGQEKILRNIVMFSSLIGLALSYFLVVNYSYIGAAYAIVISRGISGILTLIFAKNKKRILNKIKL
ncbi:flippase [Flavobacterium sp. JP2137]|uniref:flippase n=1 Tax=Flavobacterium sp. JP2137 TaxID=3414510 RepID=UPI003D2FC33E